MNGFRVDIHQDLNGPSPLTLEKTGMLSGGLYGKVQSHNGSYVSLFTVFSHSSSPGLSPETEYVPTKFGPQTVEEAEIARAALYDNNLYGGDIKFPDGWNATDVSIVAILGT
ncbi:hypothetical protein TNCV_924741 [Trichonephila clavipes]|nr:hypothetical protein TNCV_924741 [Trichonephila clavipes]